MAGVKLGLLVAVLSPVIGGLYQYFGVTYMSVGLMAAESVFQIIAHAIEGAVAGAMYKAEVAPKTEPARARYIEADVLCVELPNTPGALAKFTGKLAEKNINITMGYATGGEGSRKTTVVLAVSDVDKAAGIR